MTESYSSIPYLLTCPKYGPMFPWILSCMSQPSTQVWISHNQWYHWRGQCRRLCDRRCYCRCGLEVICPTHGWYVMLRAYMYVFVSSKCHQKGQSRRVEKGWRNQIIYKHSQTVPTPMMESSKQSMVKRTTRENCWLGFVLAERHSWDQTCSFPYLSR